MGRMAERQTRALLALAWSTDAQLHAGSSPAPSSIWVVGAVGTHNPRERK